MQLFSEVDKFAEAFSVAGEGRNRSGQGDDGFAKTDSRAILTLRSRSRIASEGQSLHHGEHERRRYWRNQRRVKNVQGQIRHWWGLLISQGPFGDLSHQFSF